MNDTTLIATRESRLALWQAEHVRSLLEQRFGLRVGLLGMTTQGDQILDRALSKVGGKGLFVHYDRFNLDLSPKAHKETGNAGAGLLHDLGPHLIDQALYLFGMPHSLFGFVATTRPHSVVNDYIDILLFYNNFNIRLKSSLIVKEPQPSFIVHGTKGSFLKPRADVQEDELKKGAKPGSDDWGKEADEGMGLLNIIKDGNTVRKLLVSERGDYMELYSRWYDAITQNMPAPVTGQDRVKVMRIIEAVQQSHHNKKIINL